MLIKRREPRTLAGESPDELRGVPAYSRPRRPPNPIRLVAAGVGAVLLLVVLVLAIPAIGTLRTLKGAGDDLRAGASRLEGKGLDLTAADTAAADADFKSAEQKFVKAES
jgi:type II secretory pathway component PulM